jgi:phospholipid-binding lipoprotein MlaA
MGSSLPTSSRAAVIPLVFLLIVAAPTMSLAAPKEDPFEGANRHGYAIHQFIDRIILRPAARTYQALVPKPIRTGLRQVISNMEEPGVLANDLLQGHPVRAAKTLTRFVANSTVGIGGLFDVAAHAGLPHHDNGFGDTFGRYGAGPGPYLFIPMVGPSTVRDLLGRVADITTDPFTWARFRQRTMVIDTRTLVGGLDQRGEADAQLKAIDAMSTDSYASLRSLYLQDRAAEIADVTTGGEAAEPALPDFDDPAPADAPQLGPPPATTALAPVTSEAVELAPAA